MFLVDRKFRVIMHDNHMNINLLDDPADPDLNHALWSDYYGQCVGVELHCNCAAGLGFYRCQPGQLGIHNTLTHQNFAMTSRYLQKPTCLHPSHFWIFLTRVINWNLMHALANNTIFNLFLRKVTGNLVGQKRFNLHVLQWFAQAMNEVWSMQKCFNFMYDAVL